MHKLKHKCKLCMPSIICHFRYEIGTPPVDHKSFSLHKNLTKVSHYRNLTRLILISSQPIISSRFIPCISQRQPTTIYLRAAYLLSHLAFFSHNNLHSACKFPKMLWNIQISMSIEKLGKLIFSITSFFENSGINFL